MLSSGSPAGRWFTEVVTRAARFSVACRPISSRYEAGCAIVSTWVSSSTATSVSSPSSRLQSQGLLMTVRRLAPHLDAADRAAALVHDHPLDLVSHRRWPTRTYWVTRTRVPSGYCGFGGGGIIVQELSVVFLGAIILKWLQEARGKAPCERLQAVTGFGAGLAAAGLVAARAFCSRWSFFLATLFRSVTSSALFQASGWVLA